MTAIIEVDQTALVIPVGAETTLSEIRPIVERWVEINKATIFDYNDKKGNKAARSHIAMLRKAKAPINDTHKRLTEEAKRFKDAVDKDRRELINLVDEMIEVHSGPLRIIEEEEKAEADRQRIAEEIEYCWDAAQEMNAMFDKQRELEKQAAEQARIAQEQAEEQRRIQIENEKREAVQRAAEEARLAEQARVAKAIEEAKQREQAAKDEAARKVHEAEEKARREKEEAEAKIKEEEGRKRKEEEQAAADLENIKRVHSAILAAIMDNNDIDEDVAKNIILDMRDGLIPAVSIDYQWKAA